MKRIFDIKQILVGSFILLLLAAPSFAGESAGAVGTREQYRQKLVHSAELPREDRLYLLGRALWKLPKPSIYPDQEAAKPLYDEALRQMVSIPGHGEYFAGRLRAEDAKLLEAGTDWGDVERKRYEIFETLRSLPSPESVSVLASYLEDDRGSREHPYPNQPDEQFYNAPANSYFAVEALGRLGLEGAVANSGRVRDAMTDGVVTSRTPTPNMAVDRPAWVQWWKEVQEGKRTYRFAGSPIEYGADGPVAVTSSPRAEPTRRTPAASGQTAPAAASHGVKIAVAVGALLLLLTAWWYFQKRKEG